ncbi:MAG: hypothetical protein KJP10_05365 [Gammaproteobacteria bacterium]|nr:hypothetical protein [Gammaproteobacteria bacterium]
MRIITKMVAVSLMSVTMQVAGQDTETAATAIPNAFPGSGGLPRPLMGNGLPPAYPEWPTRIVRTDRIPLPPPGPYMSSAMSDIDAFPSNTGGISNDRSEQHMQSSPFSKDTPWPETPERDRPELWVPESGEYRFVTEDVVRQLETQTNSRGSQPPLYQPYPRYPPPPPVRPPYFSYY